MTKEKRTLVAKIGISVIVLIVLIPIVFMQVYSLNCMVSGDCKMWSWTLASVAVLITQVYIIGFISMIIRMKKAPN